MIIYFIYLFEKWDKSIGTWKTIYVVGGGGGGGC